MAMKHEPKQAEKTPNVDAQVDSSSPRAELSDGELESVTGGASDYLLKIEAIKGEVSGTAHKSESDVLSFHWGVSQTGTALLKQ